MFEDYQDVVFKNVAIQLRGKYLFPHDSLQLVYANELVLRDMDELRDNKKIAWDPSLKSMMPHSFLGKHPVKLAVYYRSKPIGYAFGCYCEQTTSMHICWMEKRNDAHGDFEHKMLGVVLESYASYARFLEARGMTVSGIALISPIEGVKKYYTDSGFTFVHDYYDGTDAMVLNSTTGTR